MAPVGTVAMLAAASFAACIAFAGCKKKAATDNGGDNGAEAEAGLSAHAYFVATVYPAISGSCGKCHGVSGSTSTVFLAGTAEDSYAAIQNNIGLIAEPAKSPLVQHVHTDPNVMLSPEQRNVLTQWLNMEATARGLAGSIQKPATLQAAYQQFATCMNFDIWDYYRVGDLAFTQTDVDGPCMGCHSIGQGSAWLNADSRGMFEKAKEFPYIQKWVVGKVDSNGDFQELVAADRFVQKADEPCLPNPDGTPRDDCHPSFGLPPNVTNAVQNFVDTTLQNLQAGTCNAGITILRDAGADGDAGDGGK
jgi:hypothetical protein